VNQNKPTQAALAKFSPKRAWLFASPFMLMGALALVLALYGVITRQLDARAGKHLLTIIVVCVGVSMCIIGWFATKRPKPGMFLKAKYPDKPWRWREDWVAGRVANSLVRSVFFLWLAVGVFDVVCLVAVVLVLQGVRYGHSIAWLSLLFPVIGLAVTIFAARTSGAWGRFGRSIMITTGLPVAPGGVLVGEIQVPVRLQPKHAFYLRLSCVRRTTALRGKNRVTTEKILWQEEQWFSPELPQTEAGATRLPVFFKLPAELPESTFEKGDGVQWELEAHTKVSGPDFHGTFEVPVVKPVVDAALAVPVVAAEASDPGLKYQLTLDEIRKEIRSRIVVVDKPDGREFIFPAARNPGFAGGATVFLLIWSGAVVFMVVNHAPLLFPLVFTAVDVLMGIFVFDLWFRRSRVTVTPAQLHIVTAWLTLKKEVIIPVGDVASLKADIGATAGHAAYYDLRLKTRKGRELVLAKHLSHKPEADWLIRQMVGVLKRGVGTTGQGS
jgi:hypothetical protein